MRTFNYNKYFNNKTCLRFIYSVVHFEKASQLKDWNIQFITHKGITFSMTWQSDHTLFKTSVFKGGLELDQWIGEGVACVDVAFDLTKEFGVQVKVAYVQFPFDDQARYYWEFDRIKMIDGNKVIIPSSKRKYQRYRGW